MANAKRILFVSGEVAPFAASSEIGHLVRHLPEIAHESTVFETRIMMPRYGTISERRNRLHEVIRLSGAEIDMADKTETLKVKVASIPGIRLQVYFMDSVHYFKRKGMVANKEGKTFADNAERSLFFGRAALNTMTRLGWRPDIIHAFGWAGGLVPMLLKTEEAANVEFEGTKVVFTPDDVDAKATFGEDLIDRLALPISVNGHAPSTCEIGVEYADLVVYPSNAEADSGDARFGHDVEDLTDQAMRMYQDLVNEVSV